MSASYPAPAQAAVGRAEAPRRAYRVPTVRELPRRWDPLADCEIVVHSAGDADPRLRRAMTPAPTGGLV
jgi:hypothetical protein